MDGDAMRRLPPRNVCHCRTVLQQMALWTWFQVHRDVIQREAKLVHDGGEGGRGLQRNCEGKLQR